ncbi:MULTISPECIES: DUF2268 domain-containing protein [Staphylococcus]|uniref:DUF2268 domain-containing protein n=1 Tax=Staphylococcus TaxID=1279 RepID=UPI0003C0A041|nr:MULTISPECIES: DUF2268 domain-containing putative Zn-dependent protease [Staphylococcus]QAV30171.1 metallopeptidase [Sulfitobacter donghicola]AGZ25003.1 hypothetical protein STP1_0692 [Staphylococcus pasteuri SP1]KAB7645363.1 metallopeptidase [Staphylococcus sp. B2-b]MBN6853133.1 metallopeptidase [Staphylococcus warneri]MBT2769545.1 metallopeptidase [Staphylococcus warneri]
MYNIKIIRSDEVYRQLINMEKEKRNKYFKENLLREFELKFQIQQIPIDKKDHNNFDIISYLGQSHIIPSEIKLNDIDKIKEMDNQFWNDCEHSIKSAINQFEMSDVQSELKEYKFTALLGDEKKPTMFLNQNYVGDGGIPGYIILSLVPNSYTLSRVKSAIAHEINHNIRYQYVDWDGGSLAELIVAEGLAENFVEAMYGKDYIGPWVSSIEWDKNQKLIKNLLKNNLSINNIFESTPYLYGDEISKSYGGEPMGIPYAAGYTCGYYLVKYYLEKTKCSIEKATIKPADEILKEVEAFWNTNIV